MSTFFYRRMTEEQKRKKTIHTVKELLELLEVVDSIYSRKNHYSCFSDCEVQNGYDLISALKEEGESD